jgi:hypothetical protein
MTVRTISARSLNPLDNNDDAISPLHRTESRVYRVITRPEPAHVAVNTPVMQQEGIAATDYFFGCRESVSISSDEKEEKEDFRRQRSFEA